MKRLLYQLSHNHCSSDQYFPSISDQPRVDRRVQGLLPRRLAEERLAADDRTEKDFRNHVERVCAERLCAANCLLPILKKKERIVCQSIEPISDAADASVINR